MALERARAVMNPESDAAQTYAQRYGISKELAQRIINVAKAEGIDPELGFRLVRVESRFVTRAHGPSGSLGLTQLMPSTARSMDRTMNTEAEILDPQNNLRLGFRYLRSMIDRYKGDVRLGVLAYNRGEGAVDRAIRGGRDPENGYSHRVLGTQSQNPYRGQGVAQK
jgi:soluble lytic murein transglycosylase-like protein